MQIYTSPKKVCFHIQCTPQTWDQSPVENPTEALLGRDWLLLLFACLDCHIRSGSGMCKQTWILNVFNGIFTAFVAPGLTIERTQTQHTHTENTPQTAEEQKASVDTSKRESSREKNCRGDLSAAVLEGSKALEDGWFTDAKEVPDKTALKIKKMTFRILYNHTFLQYFYYYWGKINEKLIHRLCFYYCTRFKELILLQNTEFLFVKSRKQA